MPDYISFFISFVKRCLQNHIQFSTGSHYCGWAICLEGKSLKKFVLALILVMVANLTFARDNLAILPFTGGHGAEGETIAELFSFEPRLNEFFNVIPRTSIARAISNERRFQMDSGMTDPDTVISIASEVGARFVVAGSITSVGNNNLLVISIMDIRNLQQIAGDYQSYPIGRIEELRRRLPEMAENIIRTTQQNTATLPKLAIVPVQLEGNADQRVANTLTQLLAIHLIQSGIYAVFPRTESLEQVQAEHDAQMRGHTADRNIIGIGHGENPDFVLSVAARRLGNVNMFIASIINLMTREQVVGRHVEYQDINDGMWAMERMSVDLTSTPEQISQRQRMEERQRLDAERRANFTRYFGLDLGLRTGYSFVNLNPGEPNGIYENFNFLPLAAIIELKLGPFFSIQTEVQYDIYVMYGGRWGWEMYSGVGSFSVIQIPLLAKISFMPGSFLISTFAGIGFNIPVVIDDESFYSYIDVSLPLSGIIGINAGLQFNRIRLFADIRYIRDFGEMVLESSSAGGRRSYTAEKSSFDISIGMSYFIPFRR